MAKRLRRTDITGEKFGKLTAMERAGYGIDKDGKRYSLWKCQCDCGNTTIVNQHFLVSGAKKSCGCIRPGREKRNNAHHGLSHTRIYKTYCSMKTRCQSRNDQHYYNYGGRGISICEEWLGEHGFENFYNWSMKNGYQDNLTIDRIDVNGNYEPSNCRWATAKEQANNTRKNVKYCIDGEYYTLPEISEKFNIPLATLSNRLYLKKMTIHDAIKNRYLPRTLISFKGEEKTPKEWSDIYGISAATIRNRHKNGFSEEELFKPTVKGYHARREKFKKNGRKK